MTHPPQAQSAAVRINDAGQAVRVNVLCEVVYRCEGYVPRWTILVDSANHGGDRRWRYGPAIHLLTGLGFGERVAAALLDEARPA